MAVKNQSQIGGATNAQLKVEKEDITVRKATEELEIGNDSPLSRIFDLYRTTNLSKVREKISNGTHQKEAFEEHSYLVLVDKKRELVLQSSDPHSIYRLTNENSNHEDKETGSKHEVAVAEVTGFDVLPHGSGVELEDMMCM